MQKSVRSISERCVQNLLLILLSARKLSKSHRGELEKLRSPWRRLPSSPIPWIPTVPANYLSLVPSCKIRASRGAGTPSMRSIFCSIECRCIYKDRKMKVKLYLIYISFNTHGYLLVNSSDAAYFMFGENTTCGFWSSLFMLVVRLLVSNCCFVNNSPLSNIHLWK